jgi:O-antigen/teichoic acid export membrane protein
VKTKRSFFNLAFGISSQIITLALGIIIPRLFLIEFGSEVNGLIASVGQIIIYLSLLEAGVGAASLQALYKPITTDNKQSINSILKATSIYYKKTGMYYFIAIILLAIIFPFIINSTLSKLTIFIVILLTGMGGAINFYFQGKYRILLLAEGKGYIDTSIATIINIIISFTKIILLLKGYDIIAVQSSSFILTIIQIIIFQIYVKMNYKWINLNVEPNYDAISQKNSVLVHQVSYLVFRNTDILILTIFTNLKVVSVYVMYNMIFSILDNITGTVNGSITFALGQTYHESKEKFIKFYDAYETYFMAFVFSIFTSAYILIIPFMKLYTSGIDDINYINYWLPILFIVIKILINARSSANNVINIAGHFKKTQSRSIIESVINLFSSVVFVFFFGIYGVLFGTILALIYRSIDIIVYANKNVLKRSPWITFKRWLLNVSILITIIFSTEYITIDPKSYLSIIVFAIILTSIILPIYFIISSIFEKNVYQYTVNFINGYLNKLKKRKYTNN